MMAYTKVSTALAVLELRGAWNSSLDIYDARIFSATIDGMDLKVAPDTTTLHDPAQTPAFGDIRIGRQHGSVLKVRNIVQP